MEGPTNNPMGVPRYLAALLVLALAWTYWTAWQAKEAAQTTSSFIVETCEGADHHPPFAWWSAKRAVVVGLRTQMNPQTGQRMPFLALYADGLHCSIYPLGKRAYVGAENPDQDSLRAAGPLALYIVAFLMRTSQ
ncbi:MAG: hypothetical protein R3D62_02770 [Xanthobacteraceae bacterium]